MCGGKYLLGNLFIGLTLTVPWQALCELGSRGDSVGFDSLWLIESWSPDYRANTTHINASFM